MKKNIGLLTILCFWSCSVFSQTIDSVSAIIAGKWIPTPPAEGSGEESPALLKISYDFLNNGTYTKSDKNRIIIEGKWKVTESGKKINLFDNTLFEANFKSRTVDYELSFSKFNNGNFIIEHVGDDGPVLMFYKRGKKSKLSNQ